jgi:hypothetical protein
LIAQSQADVLLHCGWAGLVAIGTLCYMPTLFQMKDRRKWFKILARTLLGTGIVLLWFGAIVLLPATVVGLCFRCAFAAVFFGVFVGTLAARKRFAQKPWKTCEQGGFPFCTDNLRQKSDILAGFENASPVGDRLLAGILLSADRLKAHEIRHADTPHQDLRE